VGWVTQGLSNKEIGRHLGISPTTVKTHLHNIFERVGVSGRQHLVRYALGDAPKTRVRVDFPATHSRAGAL
jgi:DNA-binding CsgD family transcriptional regulator